jgi:hypothetical protein
MTNGIGAGVVLDSITAGSIRASLEQREDIVPMDSSC